MIKNLIVLGVAFLMGACSEAGQYTAETSDAASQNTPQGLDITHEEAQSRFPSASELFAQKAQDEMVDGSGKVVRLLPDDNKGSRHQKFLVKIAGGQTLLFAHNIDLALRIDTIKVGDTVAFRGEYSYNPKGGVVHWTHVDPRNTHEAGWIKHHGITYQ